MVAAVHEPAADLRDASAPRTGEILDGSEDGAGPIDEEDDFRPLVLSGAGYVGRDGVVNVIDTADGNIMLSLDGGCNGCSSTPMTAMQIYYSLKKLEYVNDVIFVNGELPEYMRTFIDQKMAKEAEESANNTDDDGEPQGEIV